MFAYLQSKVKFYAISILNLMCYRGFSFFFFKRVVIGLIVICCLFVLYFYVIGLEVFHAGLIPVTPFDIEHSKRIAVAFSEFSAYPVLNRLPAAVEDKLLNDLSLFVNSTSKEVTINGISNYRSCIGDVNTPNFIVFETLFKAVQYWPDFTINTSFVHDCIKLNELKVFAKQSVIDFYESGEADEYVIRDVSGSSFAVLAHVEKELIEKIAEFIVHELKVDIIRKIKAGL